MKIGVISDTHGLLRPHVLTLFAGVDRIIHAGDIGRAEVIDELRAIAPVNAIRGNNDTAPWAAALPESVAIELSGRRIFVLHDVKELAASDRYDVIVSGHSHKPKIELKDGVLHLNPGSAGPRRFKLPITVAILDLGTQVAAEIHEVG